MAAFCLSQRFLKSKQEIEKFLPTRDRNKKTKDQMYGIVNLTFLELKKRKNFRETPQDVNLDVKNENTVNKFFLRCKRTNTLGKKAWRKRQAQRQACAGSGRRVYYGSGPERPPKAQDGQAEQAKA